VLICVLGMVGGDRSLFVRKVALAKKRLGKHWFTRSSATLIAQAATHNIVVQPSLSTRKQATSTNGKKLNYFVVVFG